MTRLDFARKSGGLVLPVTGDFRIRILGELSQKESCMVYTEIRNQAENSCVCPYTDLNPRRPGETYHAMSLRVDLNL